MVNTKFDFVEIKAILEDFCVGLTQKDLGKISLYKSKKVIKKFMKKLKQNGSKTNQ